MKERPILMHARSINGIFEDRKTQTRRIVKKQPPSRWNIHRWVTDLLHEWMYQIPTFDRHQQKCPYGQPGDRLWVREAFHVLDMRPDILDSEEALIPEANCPVTISYRADDSHREMLITPEQWRPFMDNDVMNWRPGIHMFRWASRLTLEITNIRVERVQDIDMADCMAEGIRKEDLPWDPDNFHPPGSYGFVGNNNPLGKIWPTAKQAFAELWDDTNGNGAWERNDWVWIVDFKKVEA